MTTVYQHIGELITNAGVLARDGVGVTEDDLGIVPDAALVLDNKKRVVWFGKNKALPKKYLKSATRKDMSGHIIAPAFTDCHTHLVFAGSREDELALRLTGKTYQQIAAAGGGIVRSVTATRKASEQQLLATAEERLKTMLSFGARIIEIKSGYGLDWPTEQKMLRVAQKLKTKYKSKAHIKVTFLGAHAFPQGCTTPEARDEYSRLVAETMIPKVARAGLADAVDVFFDEGYFNEHQTRTILQAAQAHGLQTKIHADELVNTNGAKLAAELKTLSADHLLKASPENLRLMAQAKVTAVLLPGTAFYLGLPYVNMSVIRQAGVCPALATDFNPGSSPTLNLPFIMSLACLQMGMTMAEAFAAATFGGARALGLSQSQGHISIGQQPMLAAHRCASYKSLIGEVAHPGRATLL